MNKAFATYLLKLAVLYAAFFAAGKLALSSQLMVFAEPLTWLPAGIGLSAVLLWGPAMWPAIALGAYSITVSGAGPPQSGAVSALANVSGTLVASYLLQRSGFQHAMQRTRDVILMACFGSLLGAGVTAIIGSTLLKFMGRMASLSHGELGWLWWRGDSLAVLLVTPFILVWTAGRPRWSVARRVEGLVLLLLLLLVSLTVFGLGPLGQRPNLPLAYVHFPLLIWAAMRFGMHGTVAANLLLLAVTAWGTSRGIGPFTNRALEETLLLQWGFLGASSLTVMLLAATFTEQQSTRHALEQSEDRYRDFMEQSLDGIWRLELEEPLSLQWPEERQIEHLIRFNYLAECNDAFARMYGYQSAREVLGKKIQEFLPASDEKNLEYVRTIIRSGYRIQQAESREVDREGHSKYFLNNIVGILENGRITRIWGTQRDITDNRVLEDQLRQAQKMEAVGRLAGGVAHDFNNLLMVIGGHGELLADEGRKSPAVKKHADAILKAADRAGTLTRQLLAFGRKQVLQPRVLDLNAVVQDTGKLLHRLIGEHIELVVVLHPALGRLRADPGQIEQVLMNLAINARDAMPNGGRLTIETRNIRLDEEYRRDHPAVIPGDYIELAVTDTGVGMDEKTRAQVFEPFFTTKSLGQGTGLGLATVYGIVKQSGGYVWVYSELGRGSSFKVYLPRVYELADAQSAEGAESPLPRGNEKVLLCEDEPGVCELAAEFLRTQGYTVLETRDPKEALDLVRREGGSLALLITDVVMPGMRGTELAAQVSAMIPGIRVLFISGYTDDAITRDGVLDAGTQFLSKPFVREDLVRKARQVLDGPAVAVQRPEPGGPSVFR
jgi:PAS domain S-box-containing protein